MREIKFRVWDEQFKRMSKKPEQIRLNIANGNVHGSRSGGNVETWKLMQYTGLKDKNGVEVYEGDVVKYLTHTAHVFWSPQDFGFVHYNEVIGGYAGLSFFTGYKDFEVVGNIHQHPELLGQKQ